MPPLPSPGPIVKLNINWGVDGDSMAETIHYYRYTSGAPSAADLSAFANVVVSNGQDGFQALCNDQVGMLACTARDLSSPMGNEATAGTPWLGTRGTALTPPGAAMVISHSISRHYRGGHPRSYLPLGVSGDISTAGFWSDAFVIASDAGWGSFNAANIVTEGSLVIQDLVNVSFYGPPNRVITGSGGRVRTVSTVRGVPIVDHVTGHNARKVIGSQRRRNRDA